MNMEESSEGNDEKHVAMTSTDHNSVTSTASCKHSPQLPQLPQKKKDRPRLLRKLISRSCKGIVLGKDEEELDFHDLTQYCINLFPEVYEFERNRTVQLYLAGSFFPDQLVTKRKQFVVYARFRDLISLEVLQESTSPNCSSEQPRYKLNHSLCKRIHKDSSSSSISSQKHCRIEVDNYDASTTALSQSTLHASLVLSSSNHVSSQKIFDVFLRNSPNLRTLLLLGHHKSLVDQVPRVLFLKLGNLTVLDLSYTGITVLPNSFVNLKFLRFLDVSGTPITRLPDSICSFQDMQILILKDCLEFVGLPKELYHLRKLRHLEFDTTASSRITSMPPGIGSLTQLETLPAFIVGKEEDGCGIGELKNMRSLEGTLCISKLENVSSSDEAKKAALNLKGLLRKLELEWTNYSSSQNGFQVLESLQPPTYIRELRIVGYEGPNFPTWFGLPSFFDLVTITLYDCRCFRYFPSSLGRLPNLETLHIGEMRAVKIITQQRAMLGIGAFPRLKSLVLHGLPELEEWSGVKEGDFRLLRYLKVSCCPELTIFPELRFFSSLQQLEISGCSQLQSLPPPAHSLESLLIIDCPLLKERYKEESEDWRQISDLWIY